VEEEFGGVFCANLEFSSDKKKNQKKVQTSTKKMPNAHKSDETLDNSL